MINDPLAADLDNELNKNHNTDYDRINEEKKNIIEDSQEESDLEEKLNNLKGK
jgi:hypothetical protein